MSTNINTSGTQNWVILSPSSGSGNADVTVRGDIYEGRSARTKTLTFSAEGVASDITRKVTQQGKAEFINFNNSSFAINNSVGGSELSTWIIQGTSNAPKINFEWSSTGGTNLKVKNIQYRVNDITYNNNVDVEGDPGRSQSYVFDVGLEIVGIDKNSNETLTLKAFGSTGAYLASCIVKISNDVPYITIYPDRDIVLDSNGYDAYNANKPVVIEIDSNVQWKIEV